MHGTRTAIGETCTRSLKRTSPIKFSDFCSATSLRLGGARKLSGIPNCLATGLPLRRPHYAMAVKRPVFFELLPPILPLHKGQGSRGHVPTHDAEHSIARPRETRKIISPFAVPHRFVRTLVFAQTEITYSRRLSPPLVPQHLLDDNAYRAKTTQSHSTISIIAHGCCCWFSWIRCLSQ